MRRREYIRYPALERHDHSIRRGGSWDIIHKRSRQRTELAFKEFGYLIVGGGNLDVCAN